MEVIMQNIFESSKFDILGNLQKLLSAELNSKEKARKWFLDFEELSSKTQEYYSVIELKSQQSFNDKEVIKDKELFESKILSRVLGARREIFLKYLNSPFKNDMHPFDNKRTEKILKVHLELLNSENELFTLRQKENSLIEKYRLFIAKEKAPFLDKTSHISYLSSLRIHSLEEMRKESFQSFWESISKNKDFLLKTFLELVKNRRAQAKLSKHPYKKISHLELNKYESENLQIENDLKILIREKVPVLMESLINETFQKKLSCYDLSFYPEYPKSRLNDGEFSQKIECLLENIHPKFKTIFLELKESSCLDLFSRKGKSPGTFTVPLLMSRSAFIFGNFQSSVKDILNCMHEFGHALQILLSYKTENFLLRNTSIGFSEFIATCFEFQSINSLEKIGLERGQKKSHRKHHIVQLLLTICRHACIDDFESELYNEDYEYGETELLELWSSLYEKYFPFVEWPKNTEEFKALFWLNTQHLFYAPFYSFEYSLANISALILFCKEESFDKERLMETLRLGGQFDDSHLYSNLGIDFKSLPFLLEKLLFKLKKELEL